MKAAAEAAPAQASAPAAAHRRLSGVTIALAALIAAVAVGGITTGSMRRGQAHMWENVARVERGERPDCVVNGL